MSFLSKYSDSSKPSTIFIYCKEDEFGPVRVLGFLGDAASKYKLSSFKNYSDVDLRFRNAGANISVSTTSNYNMIKELLSKLMDVKGVKGTSVRLEMEPAMVDVPYIKQFLRNAEIKIEKLN